MEEDKIWISLLEVEPLPGSEYEDWGNAFVNGVVIADTQENAEKCFDRVLRDIGWNLLLAEDTESFMDRCSKAEVSEELKRLAQLLRYPGEVQFDCFRTWDSD